MLKGYSLRKERTQMNPFYIWVYFKRSTRQQMFNGLFLQVKIAHIAHNVCMGWVVKNSGDRLSNQTLHLQMYGFVHVGHNDERIWWWSDHALRVMISFHTIIWPPQGKTLNAPVAKLSTETNWIIRWSFTFTSDLLTFTLDLFWCSVHFLMVMVCATPCVLLQKKTGEKRFWHCTNKRGKRQAEEEMKNSTLLSLVKEKVGGELI